MYIVCLKQISPLNPVFLMRIRETCTASFVLYVRSTKYNCVLEIQDSHTSSNCAKKTLYIYGQYIKKKIQITHAQYHHFAYFLVHSLAISSCFFLSLMYICAIRASSGSSGFGSVSREHMDNSTFEMVNAGLQLSLSISRQIPPFEFTLR